ncbi:two-component system OmpR family response regulator [Bradymonas sediminis]|nr:two-component system OmpR family response regulator [Bradymonas sediminis]
MIRSASLDMVGMGIGETSYSHDTLTRPRERADTHSREPTEGSPRRRNKQDPTTQCPNMSTIKTQILVVDDDANIRQVVRFALEQAGYEVVEAPDGAAGLQAFEASSTVLVILDVMMPEMDGTEVCRQIRRVSDVPVLFLSSRDDEIDRVVGLELGADDYVTKPFSPRELVARVKAILRRTATTETPHRGAAEPARATAAPKSTAPEPASNKIRHGVLELDLDLYQAAWRGEAVILTRREFELLRALLGHPGKVYSRGELMTAAYDMGTVVSDRTIDSHIRRLRRKFENAGGEPIETVHGIGYRLGDCR